MRKSSFIALVAGVLALAACSQEQEAPVLNKADFQMEFTGKQTDLYKLTNSKGAEVWVTNFGARIVAIMVPDKNGNKQDAVIGFKNIKDYTTQASDFGSTVGRYANRINQGQITLDGKTYQLPQNNFGHCLHGGCTLEPEPLGWQNLVWDVKQVKKNSITLVMNSADGEAGFPGNVVATVTYTLTKNNAIDIVWKATTDKKTVINMTNHSYFNLNGVAGTTASSIHNHTLQIAADLYTPTDATSIPLAKHQRVDGTPFDFRVAKPIGQDIATYHPQLHIGCGYDHNYVLSHPGLDRPSAVLASPASGIRMEVLTTAPGMQLYTGNYLDGVTGKGGVSYPRRSAVCLETQQYPDSPNRRWPESTGRLNPDHPFESTTIYRFSHD